MPDPPQNTPEMNPSRPTRRQRLQAQAHLGLIEVYALWLVARDPRVPWYARAWALFVAGYAISPIDLIPDFIPLIGYLDDLVLIPFGLWVARRLIPAAVLGENRLKARELLQHKRPRSLVAAAVIILIWLGVAAAVVLWVSRLP